MLYSILLAIQVVLAIAIIALILVQHGEGADAGAAFGSGASGTVFGSQGSANFLSRTTAVLAALFFAASLGLAYLIQGGGTNGGASVVDRLGGQKTSQPAAMGAPKSEQKNGKSDLSKIPAAPKTNTNGSSNANVNKSAPSGGNGGATKAESSKPEQKTNANSNIPAPPSVDGNASQ